MKIHILGICGTFMGGVAMIARELGHDVIGSDAGIYPPMSDTLQTAGITILEGYDAAHFTPKPDLVIVGNTIGRGNPALEYVLNAGLPYVSGPQWLAEVGLKGKHVLAVSGTHGKTTTSSMLAWILEFAGLMPGFLIGGVAHDFEKTARLGDSKYFVIEADEYDTAFSDKRSKFIHYHPKTLVINNLEFDHADIFTDLAAIQTQFKYLLRTIPSGGLIIYPEGDAAISAVITAGCWTPTESLGIQKGDWSVDQIAKDGSAFTFAFQNKLYDVHWQHFGLHNIKNALAAIAAAHHIGIDVKTALDALQSFKGVKRRMEIRGSASGVTVYDDFAHHPTAIKTTIHGLRARVGDDRIIAILQFGSNTMRAGIHQKTIADALQVADQVVMLQPPKQTWDLQPVLKQLSGRAAAYSDVEEIVQNLLPQLKANDHVLIMSNKGFDNIHQRLLDALSV